MYANCKLAITRHVITIKPHDAEVGDTLRIDTEDSNPPWYKRVYAKVTGTIVTKVEYMVVTEIVNKYTLGVIPAEDLNDYLYACNTVHSQSIF